MTLIISLIGRRSLFLLADRRLTRAHSVVADDAVKVMRLDTIDGAALLGYAGLGKTRRGTEPSEWMRRTLRGMNLPLESSLGELARAAKAELPRHLGQLPHVILAPAVLAGRTRQYVISLEPSGKPGSPVFRYHREVVLNTDRSPRLMATGSGIRHLPKRESWVRPLLRLLSHFERGRASAASVADALAQINRDVHVRDKSVGPHSIVVWRDGSGGGGHHFYKGNERQSDLPMIPMIAKGMDIGQIAAVAHDHFGPALRIALEGGSAPEPDAASINEALAKLPWDPNPTLL